MPAPATWYMVDYCASDSVFLPDGLYGLKAGDGRQRGVPEGSRGQWCKLIDALRGADPEVYIHNRLAWSEEEGVHSPRNTNEGEDVFKGLGRAELADLLANLLANAVEWAPDDAGQNPDPPHAKR